MAERSPRMLPQRDVPFLDADGLINLDWYNYLKIQDDEHGGPRTDRLVRCPPFDEPQDDGAGNPYVYIGGTRYALVTA